MAAREHGEHAKKNERKANPQGVSINVAASQSGLFLFVVPNGESCVAEQLDYVLRELLHSHGTHCLPGTIVYLDRGFSTQAMFKVVLSHGGGICATLKAANPAFHAPFTVPEKHRKLSKTRQARTQIVDPRWPQHTLSCASSKIR